MKSTAKIAGIRSVNTDFDKLLSNLEPTSKQRAAIITHRETIDQALISSPTLKLLSSSCPSFLTGSYKRSTLIRPIYDVDLYVVVHFGEHAKDRQPTQVLSIILKTLRQRFRRTTIKNDSPCVVVRFTDHYFEVVPVYSIEGDPNLYAVPSEDGTHWKRCYPNIPQKWLSESNHKNDAKFVPMIKILKQWNREKKIGLKSFHLELITGLVFDHVTEIKNYPQAIYDWMFFVCRWLHENSTPFISEPGKPGTFVDKYLFATERNLRVARRKILVGLGSAQKAYYSFLDGKFGAAKSIYSQMFGTKYPSPAQPNLVANPPKLEPTPPLPQLPSTIAETVLRDVSSQSSSGLPSSIGQRPGLASLLTGNSVDRSGLSKGINLEILARAFKDLEK